MPERPPTLAEMLGLNDPTSASRRIGDRFDLKTVGELREATKQMDHKPLADAIYLYGSRARGNWTEDSDIDIYIFITDNPIVEEKPNINITKAMEYINEYRLKFAKVLGIKEIKHQIDVIASDEPLPQYFMGFHPDPNFVKNIFEDWGPEEYPFPRILLWEDG